jgi:hypothetical protein
MAISAPALACSGQGDKFNNPMKVFSDCSFENADTGKGQGNRDVLSGGKALDRGDGRVAQKVVLGGVCTHVEWLVYTECATGESIAIKGTSDVSEDRSEIAGLMLDQIANIQPPNGMIRAGRTDSVRKLEAQAKANDLMFEINSDPTMEPNGLGAFGLWQSYPANCGCAVFYPGSVGAGN